MFRVLFKLIASLLCATPAFAGEMPYGEPVFPPVNSAQVELGQLLFYDPIRFGF